MSVKLLRKEREGEKKGRVEREREKEMKDEKNIYLEKKNKGIEKAFTNRKHLKVKIHKEFIVIVFFYLHGIKELTDRHTMLIIQAGVVYVHKLCYLSYMATLTLCACECLKKIKLPISLYTRASIS